MQPIMIKDFINIECADGNSLTYLGCIETDIQPFGKPNCEALPCLILVVSDSNYNSSNTIGDKYYKHISQ